MNAFRLPGLVVVVGLLAAGLLYDETRTISADPAVELVASMPTVAGPDARSATWFCTAATADADGLADGLVTLANTSLEARTAVVSIFRGGPEPSVDGEVDERVVLVEPQSTAELRLADLAPDVPLVSIAVEVDGGGVVVERISSGPTGVDRNPCHTVGSAEWTVPSGSTGPGSQLQLAVFNPFADGVVIDVEFFTDIGSRSPEELISVHVPSRTARLIEVGDFVAASDTVTSFVRSRGGRVIVDGITALDGTTRPQGLAVVPGAAAPAETWTFAGISPPIGPANLVVVNPGDTRVRADVEVYPAGRERFVEPFELTLRAGQHAVVPLLDEGRLAEIDAFTLVVRSFDGPRIVAAMEQGPDVEDPDEVDFIETVQAPSTGRAASTGYVTPSTQLFGTVDVAEDDDRSSLHLFNPAEDTFVTATLTIAANGASRAEVVEIGPQRTIRLPLSSLGTGTFSIRIDSSGPIAGARELTGLSSRSWSPLLALEP